MSPLPSPAPSTRSGQLALILPGDGQRQTAVDVPTITGALTDAIAVTSRNWIDTQTTIEEIFDCLGEDAADEEIRRVIYRVPIEGRYYAAGVNKLLAYAYGVAAAPTGAPADTVQTITVAPGSGGTFRLALTHLGGTETTGDLPNTATAAQVKAALEALPNIGLGNTTVTFGGGVYTVTFVGKRSRASIPALVPTNNLTGGGTVAVAVTTAGGNRAHNITRNTGYQNPYFSFAIGFRDDAASFVKCYNAIVNNVRITAPANNGVVTFSAEIIFSGQAPLLGFVPPACYVPAAVLTSDCSFLYDGADFSASLVSMEFVYDNATYTGDHAYTGRRITPSRLERNNRRTSGITVTLTGKVTDSIYTDGALPWRRNVPVSCIFGTEGIHSRINAPNAIWKHNGGNSGVSFAGEGEESRLSFLAAPKRVGATHPSNVVGSMDVAATLLAAA